MEMLLDHTLVAQRPLSSSCHAVNKQDSHGLFQMNFVPVASAVPQLVRARAHAQFIRGEPAT